MRQEILGKGEMVPLTIEELKKLDKRIVEIQDPFGTGLPALRKVFEENAERYGVAVTDLMRQYMGWKWSR